MKTLLKGGILGGLVLFAWGAISWMYIPWHLKVFNDFENEAAVTKVITAQAPKSGVYMLPGVAERHKKDDAASMTADTGMKAPLVMATVRLENSLPIKRLMINELIIQILAAFLVTALMARVKGVGYMGRVAYVTLFGLAAGIVSYLPLWNWFGFSLAYTAVAIADLVVGWYFAGFVIARVTRDKMA